jgi:hypothetical protein
MESNMKSRPQNTQAKPDFHERKNRKVPMCASNEKYKNLLARPISQIQSAPRTTIPVVSHYFDCVNFSYGIGCFENKFPSLCEFCGIKHQKNGYFLLESVQIRVNNRKKWEIKIMAFYENYDKLMLKTPRFCLPFLALNF